jgi:hypothetical protein
MPYPANQARHHQFLKAQYRVKNWRTYDQALQQRGSLMVWFTPEERWCINPQVGFP